MHVSRNAFGDYDTNVGRYPFQLSHNSRYTFLFFDWRCKQYPINMTAVYKFGQPIDICFGPSGLLAGPHSVGEHLYSKSITDTAYPSSCYRRTFR